MKKLLVPLTLAIAIQSIGFSAISFAEDKAYLDLKKQLEELRATQTTMANRLQDLEIKDLSNNFKFSGVLINRFDYLDYEWMNTNQGAVTSAQGTYTVDHPRTYSTFMSLNVDVKSTEKLDFHGSLGMAKFWGEEGRNESPSGWVGSETGSYGLSGSQLRVDRAFMNYRFTSNLTGSMGRMSTNMGPPIEQIDGLSRQGTYPRFAYNGIFDGMALSYDWTSLLPEGNSLRTRLFYTPWVNANLTNRALVWRDASTGLGVQSSSPQFTFLTEYDKTNVKWARKITVDYFWYMYQNFYWQGQTAETYPTSGSTTNPALTGANGTGNNWDGQVNMLYLAAEGLFDTGLTLTGSFINYWSNVTNPAYNGPVVGYPATANAYLLTGQYQFAKLHNMIVGTEYIRTGPTFYLDEWDYLQLVPFYKVPNSSGEHIYVTMPFGDGLTLRVGTYELVAQADTTYGVPWQHFRSYYTNLRYDF